MAATIVTRDCELSTTGQDAQGRRVDPWQVTRAILDYLPAALIERGATSWYRSFGFGDNTAQPSSLATDCLRRWTSAGQCYYSDMSHAEIALAESGQPRAFAAQSISALLLVEDARRLAEEQSGASYALTAANADMLDPSISWGSHLNACVSTELWEDLLLYHRRPAALGFVSSAMAALIPFFGCGYLLPMKDGSTIFSLSARSHQISLVHGFTTTEKFRRGLLNSRREPHARGMERLHLIGFDFTLIAAALLCSVIQCMLAAAEEGYYRLILQRPVQALHQWSYGLDLTRGLLDRTATLTDGRQLTLPQFVRELVTQLIEMCEQGLISSEKAPGALDYLPLVIELTHYLEEGSFDRCARHLDWCAKLLHLLNIGRLDSAECRLADHDFTNTDPSGTLWQLWDKDLIDPLVTREEAEACLIEGPRETRAWGRGKLIERFASQICDVDWSYVELRRKQSPWAPRLRIDMPSLDSASQAHLGALLDSVADVEELEAALLQNAAGVTQTTESWNEIPRQLTKTDGSQELHDRQ